ncbi:MAG TPA: hypothetical protein VGJ26_20470 [Pirellulales bacterium]|jgi:hypothetical protein
MGVGRFQLSIASLLWSVTLIACAFGIANLGNRLDKAYDENLLVGVIIFPTFWALLFGGIGALRGKSAKWTLRGFIVAVGFVIVAVLGSLIPKLFR